MLDKMAFFVEVVKAGSISSAARKQDISVSAGSRWLQDLEQHFGMELYRRSNRLLTPTPAGQKLFDEFSPLLSSAERLTEEMFGFLKHDKGHLNIAVTPAYANHLLMEPLSRYLESNPGVTASLTVTSYALDYAADCDLVISAVARYQGYREKDLHLVRRELMRSPFVVVASPDYIKKYGEPDDPADLLHHRCLFAATLTGGNEWIFNRDGETQIIKVPKTLEVADSDLLLQGVKFGAGIGYLPAFLLKEALSKGEIVALLPDFGTSDWSLNLYYHPEGKASAAAKSMKAYLLEQLHP